MTLQEQRKAEIEALFEEWNRVAEEHRRLWNRTVDRSPPEEFSGEWEEMIWYAEGAEDQDGLILDMSFAEYVKPGAEERRGLATESKRRKASENARAC